MSQPTERLVSFGEASQLLGHAERTLRWWAAIGKITTHKFGEPTSKGARRLVPMSEVNRLIEESRVKAREAA